MFVIRLPNGNLQVPQTAVHTGDGRIIGDVYVEIGPDDTEYARLAKQALNGCEELPLSAGYAYEQMFTLRLGETDEARQTLQAAMAARRH